jgi:hypothetical protein
LTLLDENIPDAQRQQLSKWGLRSRQVGFEWGRKGKSDDDILAVLRQERRLTFLTRDGDYYRQRNCHAGYCLVFLAVPPDETAAYARRYLRASRFPNVLRSAGQGREGAGERDLLLGATVAP